MDIYNVVDKVYEIIKPFIDENIIVCKYLSPNDINFDHIVISALPFETKALHSVVDVNINVFTIPNLNGMLREYNEKKIVHSILEAVKTYKKDSSYFNISIEWIANTTLEKDKFCVRNIRLKVITEKI